MPPARAVDDPEVQRFASLLHRAWSLTDGGAKEEADGAQAGWLPPSCEGGSHE